VRCEILNRVDGEVISPQKIIGALNQHMKIKRDYIFLKVQVKPGIILTLIDERMGSRMREDE